MEQMTFDHLQSDEVYGTLYRRQGRERTPINDIEQKWLDDERCGTCSEWTLLVQTDQPPDGWGVRGLCQRLTSITNKTYTTTQTDRCQFYNPICQKCGRYAQTMEVTE